jgi:hypothetical protein
MKAEMEGLGLAIGKEVVPAFSQLFSLLEAKLYVLRNEGILRGVTQELRDYAATAVNLILSEEKGFENARIAPELIQKITMAIAGGADITQHMTDRLVTLQSYVVAAKKPTGELGDAFKKTGKEAEETGQKMVAVIRSYTDLSRALQAQLDAGSSAALKRYLETNTKILDLSAKLDVAHLQRMNRQIFQKESIEELTKAESSLNVALTKQVPTYQFNIQALTQLTQAERLRLPLIIDETSRLGQLLQASESVVSEMMTNELPARQRINLQIQRQADLAHREIEIKRQEYQQGKILLAQKEAAEVQYTAVVKSLSDQRRELIANEAGSMRSSLMMFNQAMGMGIANAIVYGDSVTKAMAQAAKATLASIAAESLIRALYNTALGFYYLALTWGVPNPASIAAFTSAAYFGAIGGVAALAGRAIPGGGQKVAGPAPYGVAGGAAGYTTGAATGAAVGQQERGPTTIFRIEGIDPNKMYSGQQLKDLIGAISDQVKVNGVVLHASTAERTVRRA